MRRAFRKAGCLQDITSDTVLWSSSGEADQGTAARQHPAV